MNTQANTAAANTNNPSAWMIGRTIRSFDFAIILNGELDRTDLTGAEAYYMEGVVQGFNDRGMIECEITRIVCGGKDVTNDADCGVPVRGPVFCTAPTKFGVGRLEVGMIQVIA